MVLSQMTDVPDNRRPRWPKIRAIDTTDHTHLSRFYLLMSIFDWPTARKSKFNLLCCYFRSLGLKTEVNYMSKKYSDPFYHMSRK